LRIPWLEAAAAPPSWTMRIGQKHFDDDGFMRILFVELSLLTPAGGARASPISR
jgi:hypothetical protein